MDRHKEGIKPVSAVKQIKPLHVSHIYTQKLTKWFDIKHELNRYRDNEKLKAYHQIFVFRNKLSKPRAIINVVLTLG